MLSGTNLTLNQVFKFKHKLFQKYKNLEYDYTIQAEQVCLNCVSIYCLPLFLILETASEVEGSGDKNSTRRLVITSEI